jgi:uncharacterized membrane protein
MITAKRTVYYWILEILSIAGLGWAFYPLLFYGNLSDVKIPSHYNVNDEIDGWGDRNVLWIIALIILILYVGFSIVERYPKWINYFVKVSDKDINSFNTLIVQMLRHLKLVTVIIFAHSNNASYNYAVGKSDEVNMHVTALLMALLFVILICFIIKINSLRKG